MSQDELRERVAEFYTSRLTPSRDRTELLAPDYDAEVLDRLSDVAGTTFGCGNPLAFAGIRPGDTVLDLGCGAGLDLVLAAEAVGPNGHVIGIDFSTGMLARAKENVARAGHSNVTLLEAGIEELPVEGGTVDWIISNCVINLAADKRRVFGEVARAEGDRRIRTNIIIEFTERRPGFGSRFRGFIGEEAQFFRNPERRLQTGQRRVVDEEAALVLGVGVKGADRVVERSTKV